MAQLSGTEPLAGPESDALLFGVGHQPCTCTQQVRPSQLARASVPGRFLGANK